MQVLSRQRGVSLIEVLMAVLIFSIGLLGMAGLLVMATRSNHSAYLRTQVTFLAGSLADRMRANPVGVWTGNYNCSQLSGDHRAPPACDSATPCNPRRTGHRVTSRCGSRQLNTFLPNPARDGCLHRVTADLPRMPGHRACRRRARPRRRPVRADGHAPAVWRQLQHDDQLDRARRRRQDNNRHASKQTFAWEFQP